VWILVIHYAFSNSKKAEDIRSGNARDVEMLQDLFGDYKDCTFIEIASPRRSEIAYILSKQGIEYHFYGFLRHFFPIYDPPSVFILFILSHGRENGVICTEQEGEVFTIYEVWKALAGNELLHDCLKINVFGVRKKIII
jgi:hypothetical protein